MDLKDYWRRLPPRAKPTAIGFVILGVVGVVVGSLVDTGWWDAASFRINVATSMVGAAVGIPFAVVFLGWFTTRHSGRINEELEQRRTTAATTNITNKAWATFKTAVTRATPPAVTEYIVTDARAVEDAAEELSAVLAAHDVTLNVDPRTLPPSTFRDEGTTLEDLRVLVKRLRHATDKIRGAISRPAEFERDWVDLQMRWTFLSTEVRSLRYGGDLGWIPIQYELTIETIARGGSPTWSAHQILERFENFAASFEGALLGPVENLFDWGHYYSALSGLQGVSLSSSCAATVSTMVELRKAVLDADGDDLWRSEAKII